MKIVINADFGGFDLSSLAIERLRAVGINSGAMLIDRYDPELVRVVEELGAAANGRASRLKVVEIPDGVEWEIDEYDGWEHVAEKHRKWE